MAATSESLYKPTVQAPFMRGHPLQCLATAPVGREGGLEPLAGASSAIRFHSDDRGALLILTGILLVLGFVILGTTLVQMNSIEDKTTRGQRDPLMETVDGLVKSFADGIRGGVEIGNTNITQFKDHSAGHVERFKDAATRVGLYTEVALYDHPAQLSYLAEKCGGFHQLRSQDGVIIGYEEDTMTETIAGAIYYINITDGRQSIRLDYYVKVFDCMDRDITTFPDSITADYGTVLGLDQLKTREDLGAAVVIKEEITGSVSSTTTLQLENIAKSGWSSESKIMADDLDFASHSSGNANDHIQADFKMSNAMKGDYVTNITLRVDAWDSLGPLAKDDSLNLQAIYNGVPFDNWTFPPLELSETTYTLYGRLSPSQNDHWTYDEVNNTTWRFWVDEHETKDPSHFFYIDFFQPTVTYVEPERHIMDAEFDWPDIPDIYGQHELEVWYKRTAGTPSESIHIQVWNNETDVWQNAGPGPLSVTSTWTQWTHTLTIHQYNDGQPRFRLVDDGDTDNTAADMDVIHLDLFGVNSVFEAP